MEAWLSDGRQVLHFRPGRWDRWSQRLELSREEARKLWAEKRKQGWQPTTAQGHPPSTGSTLKAVGESDQGIGNTTSSPNVSVGLHTLAFISREWDGCMSRPKGQGAPIVLHTIPLLAATCLTGFAMLQLVFSIGSF
jgi:hypothetical protein